MHCSQCGTRLTPTAKFCPSCGTPAERATAGAAAPARDPAAIADVHQLDFDIRRLARTDRIVGGAMVVLFVTLFLPWFSVGFATLTISADGLYHGWMYIVLILALATVLYLAFRALVPAVRLPVPHWQLLVADTGLIALLTIIGVFDKPSGTSYSWAGFVGLAAAALALSAALARRHEPEML